MLIRGTNAVKSVRLLCEQVHWEFAAGIVRRQGARRRVRSTIRDEVRRVAAEERVREQMRLIQQELSRSLSGYAYSG